MRMMLNWEVAEIALYQKRVNHRNGIIPAEHKGRIRIRFWKIKIWLISSMGL